MNINIPDKISKLFVLLGLTLLVYSIYTGDNIEKEYFLKIDEYNSLNDSLDIFDFSLNNELEELKKISEDLSIKYDVENPIYFKKDSSLIFTKVLTGSKNSLIVSDSINAYWKKYQKNKFKYNTLNKKIAQYSKRLDEGKKFKDSNIEFTAKKLLFGIIMFFIGLALWMFDEPDSLKLIKQNEKLYPFCQSCGKKFSSVRKYGTDTNSIVNHAFCEDCYKEGEFTNEGITKEEFMENALESIKHKKWLVRKILTLRFKKLERWNRDMY